MRSSNRVARLPKYTMIKKQYRLPTPSDPDANKVLSPFYPASSSSEEGEKKQYTFKEALDWYMPRNSLTPEELKKMDLLWAKHAHEERREGSCTYKTMSEEEAREFLRSKEIAPFFERFLLSKRLALEECKCKLEQCAKEIADIDASVQGRILALIESCFPE